MVEQRHNVGLQKQAVVTVLELASSLTSKHVWLFFFPPIFLLLLSGARVTGKSGNEAFGRGEEHRKQNVQCTQDLG